MNVSEQLGLNSEKVSIATDVYEGFARFTTKQDSLEALFITGSCLTIAASYSSIFDQHRAKLLFQAAAMNYEQQSYRFEMISERQNEKVNHFHEEKMAYARFLSVCGTNLDQIRSLVNADRSLELSFRSPDGLAALFLTGTVLGITDASSVAQYLRGRWIEDAHRMGSYEVGRIRFPLRQFVRLAELAKERLELSELIELADSISRRVDETFSTVRHSHHWRTLQTSVLPIEPEVLAMYITLDVAARRTTGHEQNIRDLLSNRHGEPSQAYVNVAADFSEPGESPAKTPVPI